MSFRAQLQEAIRPAVEQANKKIHDIQYRLARGIYATEFDVTAEQLWERLREAQDSWTSGSSLGMFTTFAIISELQARKQADAL